MSLEFNDENCSVCAVYHLFLTGNLQGWEAQTWSSQVFLQKGSIKISGLFLEVQRLLEVPDWVLQSETSLLQRENFCAWQNWMHIFTKLDNTLPRQATDSFLGSIYCSPDLPVASTDVPDLFLLFLHTNIALHSTALCSLLVFLMEQQSGFDLTLQYQGLILSLGRLESS